MNLFDCIKEPLTISKPIRLIELFAGIGAQAKALENIGADFETYRICEFDKYAVKSYNAVHGTDFDVSDVTQITAADLGITETDRYTYILTYSFPCQDLSLAGAQRGADKGSGTRSSLLWEVERLLKECEQKPQILLMENVPQVHGAKNLDNWKAWLDSLDELGYDSAWADLNAKDYGIPQNRNRTFCVSWLRSEYPDTRYEFPQGWALPIRLKDMLEDHVDEKYYLSDETVSRLMQDVDFPPDP